MQSRVNSIRQHESKSAKVLRYGKELQAILLVWNQNHFVNLTKDDLNALIAPVVFYWGTSVSFPRETPHCFVGV